MNLALLPDPLAICQLPADAAIPEWALRPSGILALTRTAAELTLVCAAAAVPAGVKQEPGWRALQVEGPLDFALTGVLGSLTAPLAAAHVSIFVISTFNTDYVLVKSRQLEAALAALRAAGHTIDLTPP